MGNHLIMNLQLHHLVQNDLNILKLFTINFYLINILNAKILSQKIRPGGIQGSSLSLCF